MRTPVYATLLIPALLACGGDSHKPPTSPPPRVGSDGGATVTPDLGGATDWGPAAPPRIAPHTAFITATVLDRTATAAISIDTIGALRLWPALDGTAAPIALPQRGARALEVVRHAGGFVVGAIDASGTAHLFRLTADGGLLDVVDVPAVPQAIGLVASAADAWLVVRADQSIALADGHGAIVDELSRDGTRIEALRPSGATDALAIVSRADGVDRTFAAVAITVADRHLRWGAERPLAIAPRTPVELAVAPDGAHLAYFADPAAVKAAAAAAAAAAVQPAPPPGSAGPSGAGAPAPGPRKPQPDRQFEAPRQRLAPPTEQAVAVIIATATGADVTPKALAALTLTNPQRLGFPSADALDVFSLGAGDWTVALTADADAVTSTLGRNSPPAIGPGRVVAGIGQNLVVADDGGATRYVGYQFATTTAAALSPDGTHVTWAMGAGDVTIEALDGTGAVTATAGSAVVVVEYVDDAHVVLITATGQAVLIAAADGHVVAQAQVPGSPHSAVWHPRGYLLGVRDGGGVWALPITPSATPVFGKPKVIADGSFSFWPRAGADDAAPALVTVDSSQRVRTYTAAQLATGVPLTKLGDVPSRTMTAQPLLVDSAGRVYMFDGRTVTRYASAAADDPHAFDYRQSIEQIIGVPGTDTAILADVNGATTAMALDGSVRWSASLGTSLSRLTLARDGRRALLMSMAGAVVLDTATGAIVASRCGWRFGAWPTAPQAVNNPFESACQ
ncbi:MAG: hypothetical protein IPL61_29320 [Myxococcales bacterium]|nr:hypothetical protein [Myxococcales bacterium]